MVTANDRQAIINAVLARFDFEKAFSVLRSVGLAPDTVYELKRHAEELIEQQLLNETTENGPSESEPSGQNGLRVTIYRFDGKPVAVQLSIVLLDTMMRINWNKPNAIVPMPEDEWV
jgi:hypothetical protein